MNNEDRKNTDQEETRKAYEKPEIKEVDVEVQSLGGLPSATAGC